MEMPGRFPSRQPLVQLGLATLTTIQPQDFEAQRTRTRPDALSVPVGDSNPADPRPRRASVDAADLGQR